ncbi:34602_t:CDS:1, partial [Gigaspora margarita]
MSLKKIDKEYSFLKDMFNSDNHNRLRRLDELQNDISIFIIEISEQREKLELSLKILREKIDETTDRLKIPRIEDIKKQIYDEKYFVVPRTLEILFDFKIVYSQAYLFSKMLYYRINIPFTYFQFNLNWSSRIF